MTRSRRGEYLSFFFIFTSSVLADYHIDDTNTTLTYTSGPEASWYPFNDGGVFLKLPLPNATYQIVDPFVCWNHTYRYAKCQDTDACLLTIPFTGSGITIYVYQAGPVGLNASMTIDGAPSQRQVLDAPPAPAYKVANVSMFDVQQLPSGPHAVNLLINNYLGSPSVMMFDYAYVNESLVTSATTTSVSNTATTTSTSTSAPVPTSPASHNNAGAIAGSVVGVVTLAFIGALGILWLRRRKRMPETIDLHSDSTTPTPRFGSHTLECDPVFVSTARPYDPYAEHNPVANGTLGNDLHASRDIEFPSHPFRVPPGRVGSLDMQRSSSAMSGIQDVVTPFTGSSSTSNLSSAYRTRPAVSDDVGSTPPQSQALAGHSPLNSCQEMTPLLSEAQTDFINGLYRNKVPAAAVAQVMARMLADRSAGIQEWETETKLAKANTMKKAPPSYDVMARMLADGNDAGIQEEETETKLAKTNTMKTAPPGYDHGSDGVMVEDTIV